jgi:hypothetical protein
MVMVVIPAVVLPEKGLDMPPRGLYGVGVCPGYRMNEVDAVVYGAMHVTLRSDIAVRTPTITNDRFAWFGPVTYDGHQCVSGSVPNGNKKCCTRLSFNTAKHPLTLNRLPLMIFSPTELALVNFDGPVTTTNLNRAALQEHKHGFPAELDSMCTEAIFVLNSMGRSTAHDVVHNQ